VAVAARSIHCPDRSDSAARFSGRESHSVSNRPISLAEAAASCAAPSVDAPKRFDGRADPQSQKILDVGQVEQ